MGLGNKEQDLPAAYRHIERNNGHLRSNALPRIITGIAIALDKAIVSFFQSKGYGREVTDTPLPR